MARKNKITEKTTSPSKKRRKKSRARKEGFVLSPEVKKGIWVLVLFLIAAFSVLALFNAAGTAGKYWHEFMKLFFGWGSFFVPLLLIFAGYTLFQKEAPFKKILYFGIAVLVITILGIFHSFLPFEELFNAVSEGSGGGYIGYIVSFGLISAVGEIANWIILVVLFLVSLLIIFDISFKEIFNKIEIAKERMKRKQLKVNGIQTGEDEGESEEKDEALEEVSELAEEENRDVEEKELEVLDYKEPIAEGAVLTEVRDDWEFPSIDLLNGEFGKPTSGDIKKNAELIEKTFANFGIEVEMAEVNIGPTVTQYTLKPADGVKLSKIVALQNDIALVLAAKSIRIEAPIPGRSLVGIEIPNETVALVRVREIVESGEYQNFKHKLPFSLGRDVAGVPVVAALDKMPHLLIAGATGSGKSVCMNALLMSLLYKKTPSELKLILIDPKRVEMSNYNNIPHLLTPVITDTKKTVNALKWVVGEMDRRYQLLSETGKRDIKSYNKSMRKKSLPYIVIVVDELADIMAVAAADVEGAVVRLAQMARAVGIHLVLATQRPSVDVITGLIKANITTRIAFAVASQTDSRTILDSSGAEKLLGNGDMLYISADLNKPRRIQGAFVEEGEIEKVTGSLKEKGVPDYNSDVVERNTGGSFTSSSFMSEEGGSEDALYEDAKTEIIRMGKGSASLLQRRLRVGYARAARLLDLLEQNGIVGPPDGSKPREVVGKYKLEHEGAVRELNGLDNPSEQMSEDSEETPSEEEKF